MGMTGQKNAQLQVHIRWMIRRDMADVMAIESAQKSFPWSEDEFLKALRRRNCIGMVAEADDRVVGYIIYELNKYKLSIVNFAVHPDFQRRGVASQMAAKLIGKLSNQRRTKILTTVRETNLDVQLFLRSIGFKAIEIIRELFDDTGEDGYIMVYSHDEAKPPQLLAG
ncbi:MAG: GNAT family N-acetyltransferase [Isosphaeraceae bacterium]